MQKMFSLICLAFVFSCNEKTCCDYPAFIPDFIVLDIHGNDLLNPETSNHYTHTEIEFWEILNNRRREIAIEVNTPSVRSSYYSLRTEIGFLDQETYKRFYLSLNGTSIDTISLTLEEGRAIEYELNGKSWSSDISGYYILVK